MRLLASTAPGYNIRICRDPLARLVHALPSWGCFGHPSERAILSECGDVTLTRNRCRSSPQQAL